MNIMWSLSEIYLACVDAFENVLGGRTAIFGNGGADSEMCGVNRPLTTSRNLTSTSVCEKYPEETHSGVNGLEDQYRVGKMSIHHLQRSPLQSAYNTVSEREPTLRDHLRAQRLERDLM